MLEAARTVPSIRPPVGTLDVGRVETDEGVLLRAAVESGRRAAIGSVGAVA